MLRRLSFCLLSVPPTNWLDNEQIFFLCSSISQFFDLQVGRGEAASAWRVNGGKGVVVGQPEMRSQLLLPALAGCCLGFWCLFSFAFASCRPGLNHQMDLQSRSGGEGKGVKLCGSYM